jgi:predicted nucleic acid-binding protein
MSGKTFVDTDVLIYAHDLDAKEKHKVAKQTLQELWTDRTGTLSTQVLQEFYVNVTRKLSNAVSEEVRPGRRRQIRHVVHGNNGGGDRCRFPY